MLWCLTCGALDGVEYQEMPSMAGTGTDTCTRCHRCSAAETTDPVFGRRAHPVTWPPDLTRPARPGRSDHGRRPRFPLPTHR